MHITLTNDLHGTSCRIRLLGIGSHFTTEENHIIRKALCDDPQCTCTQHPLKVRGPQHFPSHAEMAIVEDQENRFKVCEQEPSLRTFVVNASNRMLCLFHDEITHGEVEGVEEDYQPSVGAMYKRLMEKSDEALFRFFDGCNDTADPDEMCEGEHDRNAINNEMKRLFDTWGKDYDPEILLDASTEGVITHRPVYEIAGGKQFSIDGPNGQENGCRIKYMRAQVQGNPDPITAMKKVLAIVVSGGEVNSTVMFDENERVRPHVNFGSYLRTPDEFKQEIENRTATQSVYDAMYNQVEEDCEPPCHIEFSAYPNDDNDVPINNLNDVAIKGRVVLMDDGHGGFDGGSYVSAIIEDPTWIQLCYLFNESVKITKDFHHRFLEGVQHDPKVVREDELMVYRFCTGS